MDKMKSLSNRFVVLYEKLSNLTKEVVQSWTDEALRLISSEENTKSLAKCVITLVFYFHVVRNWSPSLTSHVYLTLEQGTNFSITHGDDIKCFTFHACHPIWEAFDPYQYGSIEENIVHDNIDSFIFQSENKTYTVLSNNAFITSYIFFSSITPYAVSLCLLL